MGQCTSVQDTFDDCPICLNKLNNSRKIQTTACGHRFHTICLKAWIKTMNKRNMTAHCPNCRGNLFSNEGIDSKKIKMIQNLIATNITPEQQEILQEQRRERERIIHNIVDSKLDHDIKEELNNEVNNELNNEENYDETMMLIS